MKSTYSTLLQSKFFTPAFNSAIFDGPVRIYFSQFHEALALKIYFSLQQNLSSLMSQAKNIHKQTGRNVLVMLYPTNDSFQMSFEGHSDFLVRDTLDGDNLIGINGPFEDEQLPEVMRAISDSISNWELKPTLEASFI
jgi:hypothetical protein